MLQTGVAGKLRDVHGDETLLMKELDDMSFDRVVAQLGRGMGEVLDGVEDAIAIEHSDANGSELRVEEIGAVDRSYHPKLFDCEGRGAASREIFRDHTEVGTGVCRASEQIGFAGVLVLKRTGFLCLTESMDVRGNGQGWIPGEQRKVVVGADLIGEIEEGASGPIVR